MEDKIIIAAMTIDRVIGKDNKIPWKIQEDLQLFKRLTLDNTVIMGRKTYESIGTPLKNRNNLVVSKTMQKVPGIEICGSLEEALELAGIYGSDIFFIGGAVIYEKALPIANKMYLSYVKQKYEGDTFFPKFNEEEWKIKERVNHPEFEWVSYERK